MFVRRERSDSMTTRYFTPALFGFLRELEQNNEKAWWDANKDRYISVVREPALEFINDFGAEIKNISPHFTSDSRTVGGSLMRPYRDIRFSKDKTPYKTNVGIQFRHEAGKDVHAPGFYLHLEPRRNFAGVGLWHPETATARSIRQAIYDKAEEWKTATRRKSFSDVWSVDPGEDETLKRVPREFEPDFAFADDLRMKSFVAGATLTQASVLSGSFPSALADRFMKAGPFARFLCEAVGLAF
jgi:uncharacterized protein (TIGR02453 family)